MPGYDEREFENVIMSHYIIKKKKNYTTYNNPNPYTRIQTG